MIIARPNLLKDDLQLSVQKRTLVYQIGGWFKSNDLEHDKEDVRANVLVSGVLAGVIWTVTGGYLADVDVVGHSSTAEDDKGGRRASPHVVLWQISSWRNGRRNEIMPFDLSSLNAWPEGGRTRGTVTFQTFLCLDLGGSSAWGGSILWLSSSLCIVAVSIASWCRIASWDSGSVRTVGTTRVPIGGSIGATVVVAGDWFGIPVDQLLQLGFKFLGQIKNTQLGISVGTAAASLTHGRLYWMTSLVLVFNLSRIDNLILGLGI